MSKNFINQIVPVEDLPKEDITKEKMSMNNAKKHDYETAVEKKLNELPFLFKSKKVEDETRFEILMPSEKMQVLQIRMIVDEDGDTKLRCYLTSSVEEEKIRILQEEINRLNARFRFICLSIDEDRDLCVANDFILFGEEESAVQQAITTLMLFTDVINECVPNLMPIIWKKNEDVDKSVSVKTGLFGDEGGAA